MDSEDSTECRRLLANIRARSRPVAGGSGGMGRYEMHDTYLYFELGVVLNKVCSKAGVPDEQKYEYIRRATKNLKKEFGLLDATHVFKSSVSFVDAFGDLDHFKHVSTVCGNTMKRIEAGEHIFSKYNPLGISKRDLEEFEAKLLSGTLTYKEMQRACTELRRRYEGKDAELDYAGAFHSFETVMERVDESLDGTAKLRKRLRDRTTNLSTPLRYLLQLLAREDIFRKQMKKNQSKIPSSVRATDPDFSQLYAQLRQFTSGSREARDRLRKKINPYEMGQLQNKIRATESEENYEEYKHTQEILEKIQL